MATKNLPPQLISLIHHIALNEAGWMEKTIQRFIIFSIWLSDKGQLSNIEIKNSFKNFSLSYSQNVIDQQVEKLMSSNTIFLVNKEHYKIAETELLKFDAELKKYEAIEHKAKELFIDIAKEYSMVLDLEVIWRSLNDELLSPLIQELGAKTYELISGQSASIERMARFDSFLNKHPQIARANLRKIIISFLDPKNLSTREFILRKINAYFCLEAGNLSEETIIKLTEAQKKNLVFNVFVDTNFLFSILGLHENPSNEAAQSLLKLIKDIFNKVQVKLYVAPITINEATGVLNYHLDKLKHIKPTKSIIEASKYMELSGFSERYFSESEKSGKAISAESYFSPYIKNLIATIKSKGIEFYNSRDLDKYNTDQRVIDDLHDQHEYEQKHKDHPKSYEKLLHDIVLWYFNKDQRPQIVESPADARNWIVTLDFRFLGFDAYKRKQNKNSIPLCIHPTSLIQILQFWVPRTHEFEDALLSNLSYPFLFQEFDTASEKVTLKILETLSRFEELDDLPEETITSILLNEALRIKINAAKDIEEQIQLIKEALIAENTKIKKEAEEAKRKSNMLSETITQKERENQILKETITQLQTDKKEDFENNNSLEQRILELEKERTAEKAFVKAKDKYEKDKETFVNDKWTVFCKNKNHFWYFLIALIVVGSSIFLTSYFLPNFMSARITVTMVFFISTLILSFFNRDKIMLSFRFHFRKKKVQDERFKQSEEEFIGRNKRPELVDFINDNIRQ